MKKLIHSNSKIIVNSLLFVATIFAIAIPLVKPEFEFQWKPTQTSTQIRLPLIEQTPDFFQIQFNCSTGLENDTWVINSIGGTPFQVNATKELIQITTLNKQTKELFLTKFSRQTNSTNCISQLKFKNNQWFLSEFGYEKQINNDPDSLFEISNILEWNPKSLDNNSSIIIKSKPFVLEHSSLFRNLIILAITVLIFKQLWSTSTFKLKNINLKLKTNEIFFLVYLIILGITTLPKTDDGGYLISAKALREFSLYSIYYVPVSAPTGHLHAMLNSIFASNSIPIIFGRSIPILCLFFSFVIFNRRIIYTLIPTNNKKINVLLFTLFCLASASLITIRPEPIIVLLLTINLYLISTYSKLKSYEILGKTFSIGALAVSIHQTGIIVLSISFVTLFYLKLEDLRTKKLYETLLPYLSLSIVLLFYWQTPIHAYNAYNQFTNSFEKIFPGQFNIVYPPWMEHKRLLHLLESNLSTPIVKFLTLTLILQFVFVSYLLLKKKLENNEKMLFFTSLVSFISLSFVPTKWSLYYPLYLPTLTLLIIIYFKYKSSKLNFVYFSFLLIPTAIAWTTKWSAQDSDWPLISLNITDLSLATLILQNKVILIAILLISILLFLRTKDIIISWFLISTIVLVGFQNTPVVIDSFKSNSWSFVKSNLKDLSNPLDSCAMADYVTFENRNISSLIKNNPTAPEMIYFNHCTKLLDLRKGVWQIPQYGIGPVTVLDQQRLAFNTNLTKLGCVKLANGETYDRYCYYKWDSNIPNLINY